MRFIKRLVARYKIYLRKLNRRNTYDTEKHGFNAKQCSYICRKLIHDQNSELLFAPISYKIYIKNEEHGIFITMEGGEVTITNHTYSYFIKLNNEKWIKLEKYFFKEMEARAMRMENDLEFHIKHSLDTIYNKINQPTILS